eukprot:7914726-Heterocapsa_arctica.AAC.1
MRDPSKVDEGHFARPPPQQDGNPALDEVLAYNDRPWRGDGHVEAHVDAVRQNRSALSFRAAGP